MNETTLKIIMIAGGALILFVLCDMIAGYNVAGEVTIIQKQYEPEHNSTGTGYGYNWSSGQYGIVTTTEHESEKWILIGRDEKGRIESYRASSELYYSKEVGEKAETTTRRGGWTGCPWYTHLKHPTHDLHYNHKRKSINYS